MPSRGIAVDGTVFFLVVVILISLFQVFSQTDYYLSQQPLLGIGLLAVSVVNAIAAYATWRLKKWGLILAFALSLIYTVGLYASTVLPPFGYSPIDALYGGIDISVRLIIMFLALEGYRRPLTSGQG